MIRFGIITKLVTLLFFYSCGNSSAPTVVVTIDGNILRSNEFFSTINRTEYYKLKKSIRREKILDFAITQLAAHEARLRNINLTQEALYTLATKKNLSLIHI